MVKQTELLLFDEPTSQLDPIAAAEFLSCLQKINRELGTTVIITEHRLDDIIPISDKVLVLENGRLISDDTPENTGINLKKANSECFLSLPAPMRIWEAVTTGESKCPVTITNGKAWLEEYSNNHKLHLLYEEKIPQCGDTAIQLKNIWFRYEKNSPDIIRGLSLQARFGEFLCILGGNGTGKSTLFSLINGNNKPYKGSNNSKRELCLTLPQNPQTLLNGKTVIETLNEVFEGTKLSKAERDKTIGETVALCGLEKLMSRHPFDLSGGEMQKTALAKLLLLKPKILLLDEPTKGLDAAFKEIFAKIISRLTANGTAVVMVSHDLEFCAKYAHRCALMFNGEVVANDTPRAFFNNNSFYVTAASRMSRGIIQDAITAEDVIYCCTGKRNQDDNEKQLPPAKLPEFEVVKQKKQLPLWKKLLGISGALLLVFGIIENLNLLPFLSSESLPIWANFTFIAVPVLMLMLALSSLSEKSKDVFVKKKLSKRTIAAAIMILLMIPVTIYIGNVYLYDQKYLFISLLVLLECMVPFFLVFEGRKPQARELILIAVLCALTVAGRSAFAALPQIKPVLALVIISGIALGGETGFIVGAVSMLVSNIYFGQGAWTPWQMFAAGIIGFLAGVLFQKGLLSRNRGALCVFGFIITIIIYGGIMNFSSWALSRSQLNRETILAFYIQGLPFDIIHAFSTVVFLFFIADPMQEKLERIKTKYGLIQ